MKIGMITDSPGTLSFYERLGIAAELRIGETVVAQFRPASPLLDGLRCACQDRL
jgi:hypothetical protein